MPTSMIDPTAEQMLQAIGLALLVEEAEEDLAERVSDYDEYERICGTCERWNIEKTEDRYIQYGMCDRKGPGIGGCPHPSALYHATTYVEFGCVNWELDHDL